MLVAQNGYCISPSFSAKQGGSEIMYSGGPDFIPGIISQINNIPPSLELHKKNGFKAPFAQR